MAKRKRQGKAPEPKRSRTQLNNARKRAAKKRAKEQAKRTDPSLVYIEDPLAAPTVRSAKGWFANLGAKLSLRLGPVEGWRTSAKLAVRAGAAGPRIGLFVPKSHDVVPINGCAAHHASINAALEAITTACKAARISGYDEGKGEGDLRYVKLEVERSTELVQVTLVWHASSQEEAGKPLRKLTKALQQSAELWHSIWANFHAADKHTSRILAFEKEAWVQLSGSKRWLREALSRSGAPYHCELCFPPFVFRQANLCAFEQIVAAVRRFVPPGSAVVELYGGVGTIGLHLADLAGQAG
ncbi:unnamed protein product [Symbiodinium natans]|uniref:Uncharacterized protein n=1 Tax=Symbiodinium natans TaxID=878477 RepID=A0A812M579_9DINO|nr:unnamed protein product [Symbiodinium natans]